MCTYEAQHYQTTVSLHKGKDIPRGTLHAIIGQSGLTVDEFLALL